MERVESESQIYRKQVDRRSGSTKSRPYIYSPGIRRAIETSRLELVIHDAYFAELDSNGYLVDYELSAHHTDARRIGVPVGEILGLNKIDLLCLDLSLLWHDTGKMPPDCHLYRVRREFTEEERRRIATRHTANTRTYVERRLKQVVDFADYPTLMDAYYPAGFHDSPFEIPYPRLRYIGFGVQTIDIFLAVMERRHRTKEPKTPEQALAKVNRWINSIREGTPYSPFIDELESWAEGVRLLHASLGDEQILSMVSNR